MCGIGRRTRQPPATDAAVRASAAFPRSFASRVLSPTGFELAQSFHDFFKRHRGALMLDLGHKPRTVLDLDRKSEAVLFSVQQSSLDDQFRTHFARTEMIDDDARSHSDLSGLELILHQTRAGDFGNRDEIWRRSDLRHR